MWLGWVGVLQSPKGFLPFHPRRAHDSPGFQVSAFFHSHLGSKTLQRQGSLVYERNKGTKNSVVKMPLGVSAHSQHQEQREPPPPHAFRTPVVSDRPKRGALLLHFGLFLAPASTHFLEPIFSGLHSIHLPFVLTPPRPPKQGLSLCSTQLADLEEPSW